MIQIVHKVSKGEGVFYIRRIPRYGRPFKRFIFYMLNILSELNILLHNVCVRHLNISVGGSERLQISHFIFAPLPFPAADRCRCRESNRLCGFPKRYNMYFVVHRTQRPPSAFVYSTKDLLPRVVSLFTVTLSSFPRLCT